MTALCPEAQERAAMTDAEFWERVFPQDTEPDFDDFAEDPSYATSTPCGVCGSLTACGYDQDGRPLIHAQDDPDDDVEAYL